MTDEQIRAGLEKLRESLKCRHDCTHYCPNCDNSVPDLEAFDAIDAALQRLAQAPAATQNEWLLFQQLSQALTKGNASTWEQVIDAAEKAGQVPAAPYTCLFSTQDPEAWEHHLATCRACADKERESSAAAPRPASAAVTKE